MSNKAKFFVPLGALLACGLAVGGFVLAKHSSAQTRAPEAGANKTFYTCGMHHQIIQDHPGNCPICGMKLEPVRNQAGAFDSQAIAVDPVTIQNMGIRTAV